MNCPYCKSWLYDDKMETQGYCLDCKKSFDLKTGDEIK